MEKGDKQMDKLTKEEVEGYKKDAEANPTKQYKGRVLLRVIEYFDGTKKKSSFGLKKKNSFDE